MGLILRTNHATIPPGATVSNKLLTVEQIDNNFIFLQSNLVNINIVTKNELDTLISTNSLKKGQSYRITGVDKSVNYMYENYLYGGTDIVVMAIETNKISNSGIGQFFNPKYNRNVDGYGIWDPYSTYNITLTNNAYNFFQKNEYIYSYPNGYEGRIVGDIHSNKFITINGDWTTEFSFAGEDSEATADINSVTIKTYNVGDVVFWGGRAWINTSGNVGQKAGPYEFTYSGTSSKVYDDWNPIAYTNSNYYNEVWDDIIYDYENDTIIERKDKSNNVVRTSKSNNDYTTDSSYPYSPIKAFQWGNPFDYILDGQGVGNNFIENSYCCNINFMGSAFIYNKFVNQSTLNTTNSNFSSVLYIGTYFSNNTFDNTYFGDNFVTGSIYSNELVNSGIYSNAILGDFGSNTLNNSSISNNRIYNSSISQNDLFNSSINSNIEYYGNINSNNLQYSRISDNIIINNNIQYNTLSDDSYIENNVSFEFSYNNYIVYNNLTSGSYITNIQFNNYAHGNYIQYNNLNSGSSINYIYFQNSTNNNYIQYNNLTSGSYISNISYNSNTARYNSIEYNELTSESYIYVIAYNSECNGNYIRNNNLHSSSYISNITYIANYSNCYGNNIQYNFMTSVSYIYNITYQSISNNLNICYNNLNTQGNISNIYYD